ncbi:MAG: DNA-formamidopyrimidine glycosylase, partial [Clostridia bacterium]|nr:DNA-formamidopyrimidine glycosylase [Clostridia bacterium]
MPELPEVETVRRSLQLLLEGQKITGVEVFYGGIIKNVDAEEFAALSKDKSIVSIGRRGKYLLLELSEGYTLVIHLRMTGQLLYTQADEPVTKHTHILFHLSGGHELRFVDVRKFGLIFLVKTGRWEACGGLANLGPEPLEEAFTLRAWNKLIANQKGGLKAFLLDQRKIAGIGNIYADEILFAAGLHPLKRVESLKPKEIAALYSAIVA